VPPDFAELEGFPPHVGRVVREAVTVAAMQANRDRDEALAERTGRAVIRELVAFLNTSRAPREPGR
jgi:hypothetical protein